MKIIVLGAGLVGNVIALDLAENPNNRVTVADLNQEILEELSNKADIQTIYADLSNKEMIKDIIEEFDLVIGALPGFMGYETLRTVIETGKNVVDISFFSEDPFTLDELAKEKGVTAIVDCGVAPGLSNLILGHVYSILDSTSNFLCYVGGLPQVREWPFEYKAPFSPIDVIEEYTRLARYVEDNELVVKPALSEPELLEFQKLGTLEAFNTDGLRTLLRTMNIPNMKEKTLRYPGHIEIMKIFRETGFFNREPIKVNNQTIIPLNLTSKLLFKSWKMDKDDKDLTIMRIIIEGDKNNQNVRYTYSMLDYYDEEKEVISMARTTGYTCAAVVNLISQGLFDINGIIPLELIGSNSNDFENIIEYLRERNVVLDKTIEEI